MPLKSFQRKHGVLSSSHSFSRLSAYTSFMTFPNTSTCTTEKNRPGGNYRDPMSNNDSSESFKSDANTPSQLARPSSPPQPAPSTTIIAAELQSLSHELEMEMRDAINTIPRMSLPMTSPLHTTVEASRSRLMADKHMQNLALRHDLLSYERFLPSNGQDWSMPSTSRTTSMASLHGADETKLKELLAGLKMIDDSKVKSAYEIEAKAILERINAQQSRNEQVTARTMNRSMFAGALNDSQPRRRTSLSKHAKQVLRSWFEDHLHHPYPTEDEKETLGQDAGITLDQVNNWFINTRGRKWKPMLAKLLQEKEAGSSELYDQMIDRIQQPYRQTPGARK